MSGALCSERTGKMVVKVTYKALAKYRDHPLFDDMIGAALLHVCRSLAALPEAEREGAEGLVVLRAHNGAARFLASPENDFRTTNSVGRAQIRGISLDDPEAFATSEATPKSGLKDARPRYPVVPDFAPGLVERLFQEWLFLELERLPGSEGALLQEHALGVSGRAISRARGECPMWSARRLAKARGLAKELYLR